MTDTRPPIAAAVIVRDGRVLLVQRRVSEGALLWQFPAGEVEDGETAGVAAVRETAEETGLEVSETKVLGQRVHPNTGRLMMYVACEVVDGEARVADADELAAVEWVERDRVREFVPYPFYGPVQEHLDLVLA